MAWGGTGGWGTISWGLTTTTVYPSSSPAGADAEKSKLLGFDMWWGPGSGADFSISATGDWLLIGGELALKQSVIRRIITDPGDWATRPDYGVGARSMVKQPATQANKDKLVNRTRSQLLRDPRIEKVVLIVVEDRLGGGLVMKVGIQTIGRPKTSRPILIQVDVG